MKTVLGLALLGLIGISAIKLVEFVRDFDKDLTFHLEDEINGE